MLGKYVPVNYHCLYDLSVLMEGFWLSVEHPKRCIICGAVETASSTQNNGPFPALSICLIDTNICMRHLQIISSDVSLPIFNLSLTFCSSWGLWNEGEGVLYCIQGILISFPMFPGLFLQQPLKPWKHREFSYFPGLSYIISQALYLIIFQGKLNRFPVCLLGLLCL